MIEDKVNSMPGVTEIKKTQALKESQIAEKTFK